MTRQPPSGTGTPHYLGFTIILRHTTIGRTTLYESSARRGNLTWQNTTLTRDRHPCPRPDSNPQSKQASGRKTHALDRAANGIDRHKEILWYIFISVNSIRNHDFGVQADFLQPDVSATDRRTHKNAFTIVGFLVRTDSVYRQQKASLFLQYKQLDAPLYQFHFILE